MSPAVMRSNASWSAVPEDSMEKQSRFLSKTELLFFLTNVVLCLSFNLECEIRGHAEVDVFLVQNTKQLLDCHLFDLPHLSLLPNDSFTLSARVYNSTWSKSYYFGKGQTSWNVSFPIDDFFELGTDYTILPKPSPNHIRTSHKWFVRLEACNPALPFCQPDMLGAIHKYSEIISKRLWGLPISDPVHYSNDMDSHMSLTSNNYVTLVNAPCQSGSSLMIFSNSTSTYIFSSWNAFESSATRRYLFDCSLIEETNCHGIVVYDAIVTDAKLLILTSQGMYASKVTNSKDMVKYHKLTVGVEEQQLIWSSGQLSFSPLCAEMDYFLYKDDVLLLNIETTTEEKLLFHSSYPYQEWLPWKRLSSDVRAVSAVHDIQRGNIISILTYANGVSEAQVYFRNDSSTVKVTPFIFPSHGQERPLVLLQSNHFLYVSTGSSLWLSTDGGNHFVRLVKLTAEEHILQLIGYEPIKSFALLTSRGRVLHGKAGVADVKNIFNVTESPFSLRLMFNSIGKMFLVDSKHVRADVQLRNLTPILFENTRCRYSLVGKPRMPATQTCDLQRKIEIVVSTEQAAVAKGILSPPLSVVIGNPSLMRSEIQQTMTTPFQFVVKIKLTSLFLIHGATSVSVNIVDSHKFCPITSYNVIVLVGCPYYLRMVFQYSSFLIRQKPLTIYEYVSNNTRGLTYTLAENYRPPSSLGVSIPLSSNVYNAHPESINNSKFFDYEIATKHRLKAPCAGKSTRSECRCTSAQKFSSLVEHSDCRERVYQVLYNTQYQLNITFQGHKSLYDEIDIETCLVYVEEINHRDQSVYTVEDNSETFCRSYPDTLICRAAVPASGQLRNYLTRGSNNRLYNATQLNIKFQGSGMFHFRVHAARGFSFCHLTEEFQVYVINPPLRFPTGTIIRLLVSFVMGGVMILIYMKFLYSQPKLTKWKTGDLGNLFANSNTTTDSLNSLFGRTSVRSGTLSNEEE